MKKRICLTVITVVLIIIIGFNAVQAITYSDLEQKRVELRNKINEAGKSLENINVELTEKLDEINKLDGEINTYEKQVSNITQNLQNIEKQIKETEEQLKTIEEKYDYQKKGLLNNLS